MAEVGKPGANWKAVTPANRKTVNPLVKHYMKMAHPFTQCVADNTKRFGKERAEKVCAVVKDMGMRTTKWRKGGKKVKEMEVDYWAGRLLEAADGDVDAVEEMLKLQIQEDERAAVEAVAELSARGALEEKWSDAARRASALARGRATGNTARVLDSGPHSPRAPKPRKRDGWSERDSPAGWDDDDDSALLALERGARTELTLRRGKHR